MDTSNRHRHEPPSGEAARPSLQGSDSDFTDREDESVIDDDVSDFFDEVDPNPGDRRRDPLRRG